MEPYHSEILQEFMDLPYENPSPLWPADKPLQPLLKVPPIDSEYLLPDNPEEWTGAVVCDDAGATLYIFESGQWWRFPRVADYAHTSIYPHDEILFLSVKAKELYEGLQKMVDIGMYERAEDNEVRSEAIKLLEKYKP